MDRDPPALRSAGHAKRDTLAVLLPRESARHVESVLPAMGIRIAGSWRHLAEMVKSAGILCALVDPQIDGDNTSRAMELVSRYPRPPIFAYVQPNAKSLHSVFRLSQHGLDAVFVHPVGEQDSRFRNAVERAQGENLASDVLLSVEAKLRSLPDQISLAVVELFRRPYRFQSARDLSAQANVSPRCLRRALNRVHIGTPRHLITLAKILHGYCYLGIESRTVREVSGRLGYTRPAVLATHFKRQLGGTPSTIRAMVNAQDVLVYVIEELNKPSLMQPHLRRERSRL